MVKIALISVIKGDFTMPDMTAQELAGMDEDSTPALLDWGLADDTEEI